MEVRGHQGRIGGGGTAPPPPTSAALSRHFPRRGGGGGSACLFPVSLRIPSESPLLVNIAWPMRRHSPRSSATHQRPAKVRRRAAGAHGRPQG